MTTQLERCDDATKPGVWLPVPRVTEPAAAKAYAAEVEALFVTCKRLLTDGQIANLFGERMTTIVNERDQMRADKDLLLVRWRDEQALRIAAEAALLTISRAPAAQDAGEASRGAVGPRLDWIPIERELPDADITVLIGCSDGEVYQGAYDGGDGTDLDGFMFENLSRPMPGVFVKCWAEMPAVPEVVL